MSTYTVSPKDAWRQPAQREEWCPGLSKW